MSFEPRDPWRLGALERIGSQLRDLESQDRGRALGNVRVRRRIAFSGGLAAAVTAILLLVLAGRVAQALSPVNRAPAAAAASASVHFSSTITITQGHQHRERFTEQGRIDFATGDFSTTLSLPLAGRTIERRIAGGVFYIAQAPRGAHPGTQVHWIALRLAGGRRASFSSAPEGDSFTDPPALFRAMSRNRARVSALGRQDTGGVATTHYRLFTDLATFLRTSSSRKGFPASYRKVPATLDVWLDQSGRPRRVDEHLAGASSLGPARITTRIDFVGYGRPVTVRAPPRASVISERRISTPRALVADPSRLFEHLLLARD